MRGEAQKQDRPKPTRRGSGRSITQKARNPKATARTIIQAKRPHSPLTGPTSTTKDYLAYKRIRILSFATQVSMNERMLAFEPTRIPSWWQYRS